MNSFFFRATHVVSFGILLSVGLAAGVSSSRAAEIPPSIDQVAPQLMTKHKVPGVTVLAIENRRIAQERYLGVRAAGRPEAMDDKTIMEVASMTKPLVACIALKFAEEGKLDLDRSLSSYLAAPYLPEEPKSNLITARMVLSHTSGFPNWRPKGGSLKLIAEPGTAYGYSGEGFQMLQAAMEHIAGKDLEALAECYVFAPLGMKDSSLVWRESYRDHAAAGHDPEGKVKADRRLYLQPYAAYSLYTTARDYTAFVLEMMDRDRSRPFSISAESLRLLFTPVSPPTDEPLVIRRGSKGKGETRYSLGWLIEPTPSGPRVTHHGWTRTGFRCHVEFDPARGSGLLILTNSDAGRDFWQELVGCIGTP